MACREIVVSGDMRKRGFQSGRNRRLIKRSVFRDVNKDSRRAIRKERIKRSKAFGDPLELKASVPGHKPGDQAAGKNHLAETHYVGSVLFHVPVAVITDAIFLHANLIRFKMEFLHIISVKAGTTEDYDNSHHGRAVAGKSS